MNLSTRHIPSKKTFVQLCKFAMVGVSNTIISLCVFYLLYNLFDVNYTIANLLSYIIGVINSFIWNKFWVFHPQNGNTIREILLFILVFGTSYGVQYGGLYLFVEIEHITPNWAQLPAMVIYTLVNYILNRFITFKQ